MKYYIYTTDEGTLLFVCTLLPDKKCLGVIRCDAETLSNLRKAEGITYAFLRDMKRIMRGT